MRAGVFAASDAVVSGTHSAETTRRALPSMRTANSPGVRLASGFPWLSTTATSTDLTSTEDLKRGCCASPCCADSGSAANINVHAIRIDRARAVIFLVTRGISVALEPDLGG